MSDLDSLRHILALPDDDAAAPEPDDGQPAGNAAAAEPEADEGDEALSPEELVAEAVRQDREAHGEPDEDEDAAQTAEAEEGEDENLDEIREKARKYDEAQLAEQQRKITEAQAQLTQARSNLDAGEKQRKTDAHAHYDAERTRISAQIWADAQNSPDPGAYYRLHHEPAMRGVRQQEDAWLGQIEQEFTNARSELARADEALQVEANKPRYVKWLIAEVGLLDDPRMEAALLRVSDVNRMPERALELKAMQDHWQQQAAASVQVQAEAAAVKIKATQPHSSATGKPRRRKPVEYTGSAAELRAIEALR